MLRNSFEFTLKQEERSMKNQKNNKETSVFVEKEWYKKKIIEMSQQIDDVKFLKRIYISLRDYIYEK